MKENERDPKREQEDKVRFINYLLQMIEKYGAKILAEQQAVSNIEQTTEDRD